jgi:polysaccharide pyruvyl transferase WcaK-like protein
MKDIYKNLEVFHFAETIKKQSAKKRLRCLIFGNFGAMNYGDEAILSGEIQELKKIPNITITVASRFPQAVKKMHGVNAISWYAVPALLDVIRKSDFVVVGGGGLINKIERGAIGFAYQVYMLSLFFLTPLLYRKKFYVLGVGIYSNANPVIMSFSRLLLKKAALITVRDHHSYEFLQSKKLPVKLFKDNSFLMDLLSVQQAQSDKYFKMYYRKDKRNVGISLLKPDSKEEEKHLLSELAAFIAKEHENTDFWFYPSDNNPAYFNDEKFGRLLYDKVKKIRTSSGSKVVFHFVPTDAGPQKFFSSFKLMDSFIAMRLHAAIFAYRSGIKFVGISYDKKCASFLRSIGKEPVEIKDVSWKQLQKELN